jgi:nucleotide-binding universal stress UspA family protein
MRYTYQKMKTFLLPTDFSNTATHAVEYAYSLASQVNANIVICNAVLLPSESPQVGLSVWPPEDSEDLLKDSADQLENLASSIRDTVEKGAFKPAIKLIHKSGSVYRTIQKILESEPIDLVVIGTHETGMLDTLLLGDEARALIDETTRPLLLVPPSAEIKPVKKIAFATDFKDLKKDMESLETLISIAMPLEAKIYITHIYNEEAQSPELQQTIQKMINGLSENTNYPNVYFNSFENSSAGSGLEELCFQGNIDMLAMVHRSHTFIDSLFRGSQTQKISRHMPIPLLVFPASAKPI